jgi:hypothetical protein
MVKDLCTLHETFDNVGVLDGKYRRADGVCFQPLAFQAAPRRVAGVEAAPQT